MSITRANVEAILIRRAGKKMTVAGLDGTTISGSNPDLNDPIGSAILDMGYNPSSIATITDTDVSLVGNSISELLDRAELRLLRNIAGNLDLVDIAVGPRKESLSQLHDQIIKQIDKLADDINSKYGSGISALDAGSISLDFQEEQE
jgi:hypothetical protein